MSSLLDFKTAVYTGSLIAVPVIFIIAFALHPNLLDMKPVKKADAWVKEFRHNKKLHMLHFLVLGNTLLIINIAVNMMNTLKEDYEIYGMIGGTLGIIGAVALAVDKGALCLVPSAFDTLKEEEFMKLMPGLQTLLDGKGFMWAVKLLILLPIGFIILAAGLLLSGSVPAWQGVTLIIGMLFMINPDIDLLSLIGSCFMMISFGGMVFF